MTGKLTLSIAALVLSVSAGPGFAAAPYSSIVSFGDSLSDVGNVLASTKGIAPASPYFDGRFSNGPNWLDDLARELGLPLKPSFSLQSPTVPVGNDFAWGGATTGYSVTNNVTVPNLETQVGQYLLTYGHGDPNALYTVSIGANDLFAILASRVDLPTAETEAAGAASIVAQEAGMLAGAGAKNLVLFDVPNLGLTPKIIAEGQDAVTAAKDLSAYFDQQVLTDLAPVEKQGLKVFDLDTFSLIGTVVANPSAYGFSNVTDACYVGPITGGGSECGKPNTYLFWDGVHPSERAGGFIANDALAKVAPEPSTWAMLTLGFAGLAGVGLKARKRAAAA